MVLRSTYKRHRHLIPTAPPLPPSFVTLPMTMDTATDVDDVNSPSSETSQNPVPDFQTPYINMVDHVRQMLSQKRTSFDFPPSLVFVAPPTEDLSCYSPRAVDQLSVPNSYYPLSLVDVDSVAVISYEYLLVEYLDVLDSLPPQAGHASVYQVETLRSEILDTLQYLDRRRGDEWNKQLQAQLDPNTFVISGKDQCTP